MRRIDVEDLSAAIEAYLEAAAGGETIIITRGGKAVAQIAPFHDKQRIGFMEGEFDVPDDFDRLAEKEIARLLTGKR